MPKTTDSALAVMFREARRIRGDRRDARDSIGDPRLAVIYAAQTLGKEARLAIEHHAERYAAYHTFEAQMDPNDGDECAELARLHRRLSLCTVSAIRCTADVPYAEEIPA